MLASIRFSVHKEARLDEEQRVEEWTWMWTWRVVAKFPKFLPRLEQRGHGSAEEVH